MQTAAQDTLNENPGIQAAAVDVATPSVQPKVKPELAMAPAFEGPRQARVAWDALLALANEREPLLIDMSQVVDLQRTAMAAVTRFLQAADKRGIQVVFCRIPRKTQAMLEILGLHHLIEFRSDI